MAHDEKESEWDKGIQLQRCRLTLYQSRTRSSRFYSWFVPQLFILTYRIIPTLLRFLGDFRYPSNGLRQFIYLMVISGRLWDYVEEEVDQRTFHFEDYRIPKWKLYSLSIKNIYELFLIPFNVDGNNIITNFEKQISLLPFTLHNRIMFWRSKGKWVHLKFFFFEKVMFSWKEVICIAIKVFENIAHLVLPLWPTMHLLHMFVN